jgi:hypothetical protein
MPVWYAAYGSNLAWARFRCYVHGGIPAGSDRPYEGCRQRRDPIESRRHSLPMSLAFARRARSWGNGGVAFLGHRPNAERPTLARLYLLEHQQLEDVIAQENGQPSGDVVVSLAATSVRGHQDVCERGWYRRVLHLGELDGLSILTCTAAEDVDRVEPVAPTPSYLRWICVGLRETWALSSADIAAYLSAIPGMAAFGPLAALRQVVEDLLRA